MFDWRHGCSFDRNRMLLYTFLQQAVLFALSLLTFAEVCRLSRGIFTCLTCHNKLLIGFHAFKLLFQNRKEELFLKLPSIWSCALFHLLITFRLLVSFFLFPFRHPETTYNSTAFGISCFAIRPAEINSVYFFILKIYISLLSRSILFLLSFHTSVSGFYYFKPPASLFSVVNIYLISSWIWLSSYFVHNFCLVHF